MSFQVVECELDEQGEVVERKVVPYPLPKPTGGDGRN